MRVEVSATSARPLRVLVVDDSAVVRQAVSRLLGAEPGLTVEVAADPLIALAKIRRQPPDVIVLDLQMPRMDGLTFLEQLMRERPTPVVICSAVAPRGTEQALRALDAGAVEIVTKPNLQEGFQLESTVALVDAVRAASLRRQRPASVGEARPASLAPVAFEGAATTVVALGASTGGPEALHWILGAMPREAPGMVVVQHMPEGFTTAFAKRLDSLCRMEVREAVDGDPVRPGRVLIAPGNRHLRLVRAPLGYAVSVRAGPLVSRHRPSVDELFQSVAETAGANAVGVLLTGMGSDGAEGLWAMRQRGATTIAQAELGCVVFGMPKEAIDRGAADQIVPLEKIPSALAIAARRRARAGPAVLAKPVTARH